jgi:hypothetical protein
MMNTIQPKQMPILTLALALILAASMLGACSLPTSAPSAPSAPLNLILSEPRDEAHYPFGSTVAVRTQVASGGSDILYELLVDGKTARADRPNPPLRRGALLQPWVPPAPGTYRLQVRGGSAVTAIVTVYIDSVPTASPTFTPTATTTNTPTPTITSSPTFTPTPTQTLTPTLGAPVATAHIDANCRGGPGTVYDYLSYLHNGQSSPVTGRSADWTWWVILRVDGGGSCWISAGVVTVSGDTSRVPVIAAPPTPTSPPTLPAPEPVSPSGSLSCRSTVTLEWNGISYAPGIDHYEWKLAGKLNKTGSVSGLKKETSVACGGSYTWQVRAVGKDGVTGPYSSPMGFKIN